ncbi:MAG: pilus assembly protein TadG-related protein [Aeromicrobium sp.]|uniref:pilus assembly protein TadG-related protein n=1 Tax=Aeromicrobium sp. TaxID=1871063 RepID=UPI003C5AAF8C
MRKLSQSCRPTRDERGVAAMFVGLSLALIIGSLGLSVDVGHVAYQKTRAQHAADAAARQLAYQCARYPTGSACSSLQASATAIAGDSIESGTVTAVRDSAAKTVTVNVGKTVDTNLLALIGVATKDVLATATAKVGVMGPTAAYNVLPLGVHYCTWKNWSNLAGTPTEATRKTTLRTDVMQGLENLLSPVTSEVQNTVEITGLTDQLRAVTGADPAVENCLDGSNNQILTLTGATWLTGETVVSSVVKGLFNWDAAKCELDVDNDVETFIGGLENNGFMPQGCPSHFGHGKLVDKDKTILLPVFQPKSALQDRLDLMVGACAGLLPSAKTCVKIPPKIGVEVVGFAPFRVTGWKYPGNPSNVDGSVGCSAIPLKLNLRSLVSNLLSALERTVNSVLLLAMPTNLTSTISCNGLQGYFTKSFTKDPRFRYETGADDFGASYASLVD